MEKTALMPAGYAAVTIQPTSAVGMVVSEGFGTLTSQIDMATGAATTSAFFGSDADDNLTVAAGVADAPALVRCFSATGSIADVTIETIEAAS